MKTTKEIRKTLILLLLAMILCLLAGCGDAGTDDKEGADSPDSIPDVSEFADKRIAVMTGTNFPDIIEAEFPNAERVFYNSVSDMIMGMDSDKVDAIALDEPVARNVIAEQGRGAIANGYLAEFDFAYNFAKTDRGHELCDELSEFMVGLREDGRMQELQEKWFDSKAEESMMPFNPAELPDTNGTIRVATLQYPPFSLQGENSFYGYDAELLGLFGKEKGYRIEFTDMSPDAITPAVNSGKFDMGAGAASVTEERKEIMLFSEPEFSGGVVLLIPDSDSANDSVLSKIRISFEKTFVREGRYKMFIQGIGVTILIVILSALFGTMLGYFIFMACRHGNPVANKLAGAFNWLMSGMPIVVLLMILYYIIFANLPIGGTAVAVVAFTMTFGAEVYSMLKTAVGAVDGGQMEAAYALGYTDRMAFYKHILPQALPHFMPAFRGSLVSLIKATSVVGYVTVQDLTRMGDIVRSKTYEAFFPLIAVAIMYFVIAGILVFIVNKIMIRFEPKSRNKDDILKGVTIHD